MEIMELFGRVAQHHGTGAAVAAAVALVGFRFYFAKYFDKTKDLARREDVEKLRPEIESTRRELEAIKLQLSRVHSLALLQQAHVQSAVDPAGAAPLASKADTIDRLPARQGGDNS